MSSVPLQRERIIDDYVEQWFREKPLRARLHAYLLTTSELCLLEAMCEQNSDGQRIYASLPTLAAYSKLSLRQVQRLIGRNEDKETHKVLPPDPGSLLDKCYLREIAPPNAKKRFPATYAINEAAMKIDPAIRKVFEDRAKQRTLPGITPLRKPWEQRPLVTPCHQNTGGDKSAPPGDTMSPGCLESNEHAKTGIEMMSAVEKIQQIRASEGNSRQLLQSHPGDTMSPATLVTPCHRTGDTMSPNSRSCIRSKSKSDDDGVEITLPKRNNSNTIIIGVDLQQKPDSVRVEVPDAVLAGSSPQSPDSVRDEYIRKALNVYRETPGNSSTTNQSDAVLAGQWYDQKIAIETIENALTMGAFRRYCSFFNAVLFENKIDIKPPPLIRSLKYFQGVLDEVRETKVSTDYYRGIRLKMDNYLKDVMAAQKCAQSGGN